MMWRRGVIPLLFLVGIFYQTSAYAQDKESIELKAVVEKEVYVVNEEGKEELTRIEVTRAVPGDQVIFSSYFTNTGRETAENLIITNPVPEHMQYIAESASGEETSISFSIDDGKTFNAPENLIVRDAAGKEHQAEASEYTHIRWKLRQSLDPGETGYVSFRAVLE